MKLALTYNVYCPEITPTHQKTVIVDVDVESQIPDEIRNDPHYALTMITEVVEV